MKLINKVTVKRFADNDETSIGLIYFDGIFKCCSIEDQEQKDKKVKGETRVSNGVFRLALRNEGGVNQKYLAKYGSEFHKGMLCIYNGKNWTLNCPDGKQFQYVLYHLGNTEKDTDACLLPNYGIDTKLFLGNNSGRAYEDTYPIIRDSILASNKIDEFGNKYIDIEYTDIEEGK